MTTRPPGGDVAGLLRRHDIRLTGRLGQHLLTDRALLAQTAEATGAGPDSLVLEIGAGIANLTAALARTGARVRALELDERFRPIHREFAAMNADLAARVEFVYTDALDYDYAALGREAESAGLRLVIAGNIPYQITSPLIMNILESGAPFDAMTLMMQREVADRLAARPGSKRNGGISIKVQYFCDIEAVLQVPRRAFLPPPEVESTVLRFRRKPARLDEAGRRALFQLVDAAFAQRRKVLPNSVAAAGPGYSKERVELALGAMGLDARIRAEALGLDEFMALLEQLRSTGK